jgi:hypothetical protein
LNDESSRVHAFLDSLSTFHFKVLSFEGIKTASSPEQARGWHSQPVAESVRCYCTLMHVLISILSCMV